MQTGNYILFNNAKRLLKAFKFIRINLKQYSKR